MKGYLSRPFATATILACALYPSLIHAAAGDIYVGGFSTTIERFAPDGTESVFATGVGVVRGLAFDVSGNLFAASDDNKIYKITPNGAVTTFALVSGPAALAFDSAGNLFASAYEGNIDGIRKFAPDGSYITLDTGFAAIHGLTCDSGGDLFSVTKLVGTLPYKIYKYPPGGVRTLFSGTSPGNLTIDSSGNLYVGSGFGVTKYGPDGTISTFTTDVYEVEGLAFDASGNLVELNSGTSEIYKFAPDGTRSTFYSGLNSYSLSLAIAPQVPEPSGCALLAIGAALVIERRRRAGPVRRWYCLMSNHFHLVVETPQPNLVTGMKWFLGK